MADSINSLAATDEQIFVLSSSQLQAIIERAVKNALEADEDHGHDQKLTEDEIMILKKLLDADVLERLDAQSLKLNRLKEKLETIESKSGRIGKKSSDRIEALKLILRKNGGTRPFRALMQDLGLSPSQFSQLLNKLDKRTFEVALDPRSRKAEKVLRLKKRLMDPLIVA